MSQQYTNEQTPDVLSTMELSPFTPEQLANMSDEARALIEEQEAFCRAHPVTAIYRLSVARCLTQLGGSGDEFNPNPEEGHKIRLESGMWVSVLTEDCTVTYPDGTQARIITGVGNQYTHDGRDGVPMPEDFLTMSGA